MYQFKNSFSGRLVIISTVSIVIPLLISVILSGLLYQNMTKQENLQRQKKQVNFVAEYLDILFENVNDNINIFYDQHISNIFEVLDQAPVLTEQQQKTIESSLLDFCYIYSDYSNAYILNAAENHIYSAYKEAKEVDCGEVVTSSWYEQVEGTYSFGVFSYPFSDDKFIACVKPWRDNITLELKGYCMVKMKAAVIQNIFDMYHAEGGEMYCISTEGFLVTSSDKKSSEWSGDLINFIQNSKEDTVSEEGKIYCWQKLQHSDLYIVNVSPQVAVTAVDSSPYFVGIILMVLLSFIALLINIKLVRQFVRPVSHIANVMQNADLNNLEPIPLSGRTDELGTLEICYNNMVQNFNDLLEKQYKTELSAKKAQIRAIQLQINPHFVNNTLQMIGYIAMKNGMTDIYSLICSFSHMFYYSLKYKNDIVQVQDEIKYLHDYMVIQKERYPDKFVVEYNIDPRIYDYEIPKMTIQPIVENCFSHAFEDGEKKWFIRITGIWQSDGSCRIAIQDNGKGLSQEQVEQMNQMFLQGATFQLDYDGGIGLQNVNQRLHFLCTKSFLKIQSSQGDGTVVIINLSGKDAQDDQGIDS